MPTEPKWTHHSISAAVDARLDRYRGKPIPPRAEAVAAAVRRVSTAHSADLARHVPLLLSVLEDELREDLA